MGSEQDHSKYKEFGRCITTNAQSRRTKPLHTSGQCDCEEFEDSQRELRAIISQNQPPLLQLFRDENIKLQSCDLAKAAEKYVAISHSWSDGLGSPAKNIMSKCHLMRLSQRVHSVAKRQGQNEGNTQNYYSLFLIDTLSVPGEEGPLKPKAIASIEQVYREASAVLVLEARLEVGNAPMSSTNRLLRVASSSWWTRFWTLQECIFAKELYFQFHDCAFYTSRIDSLDRRTRPI